jgi:hypothetical protein
MAPAYQTPSLASVSVTMSPTSSGVVLQYALIFESVANILACSGFLYYADSFNNLMVQHPKLHTVSPFTVELFVGFLTTITIPTLLCIPNTKRAVESRPTLYAMLLTSEILLCAQFAFEALTGHNGLSAESCWFAVAIVVPWGLWRIWVLGFHPEWMGSYKEGGVKRA